jgi:hypothetical protein
MTSVVSLMGARSSSLKDGSRVRGGRAWRGGVGSGMLANLTKDAVRHSMKRDFEAPAPGMVREVSASFLGGR